MHKELKEMLQDIMKQLLVLKADVKGAAEELARIDVEVNEISNIVEKALDE